MDFNVLSPANRSELLAVIKELQGSSFRFCAGGTDVLLEIRKSKPVGLTVVNLNRLKDDEFTAIKLNEAELRIGSLATVARIAVNPVAAERYPVLQQAANSLASRQIREVATVGGNICTASPAGDVACALVALKTDCDILRADGSARSVSIGDFFTGVRKTVLGTDEILRSVILHPNYPGVKLQSGFIKVGIRRSMECAVVSLAYHIQVTEKDEVVEAGLAIGSAAPTIRFAPEASQFLIGRNLRLLDIDSIETFAELITRVASPISDKRGSAEYRRTTLRNISKGILEDIKKSLI